MGEVVGLRGEVLPQRGQPNRELVSLCQELLAAAEAGEVIAAHISLRFYDDTHARWFAGEATLGTIGNLDRLKHILCTEMDAASGEGAA